MNWQRIDENTYIDDTLVTCAEYQLFIDEMREQGKYYQPDHWTSYQFPEGNARAALLGARFLDTRDFCEWLTARGNREWFYRIPFPREAINHPMNISEARIGYWTGNYLVADSSRFLWIGPIPVDARGLNSEDVLAFTQETMAQVEQFLQNEIVHSIVRSQNKPIDLLNVEALINAMNFSIRLDPSRRLSTVHILNQVSDHLLEQARLIDRAKNRYTVMSFVRSLFQPKMNILGLTRHFFRTRNQANDPDFALDMYIDIYTLQERIAGRSPAFEGIRLVKERIR